MNNTSLIKRIPYKLALFTIIFIAALFEGIGIASMIPVISFVTNEADLSSLTFPFSILPNFFNYLNLEISLSSMLIFVLSLMILSFFTIYLQERLVQLVRYKILYDNREEIGKSIFMSNWKQGLNYASGEISNKLVHETDKLSEALINLILLIALTFQFLIYIIIALYLSFILTVVILIIIFISFILIYPLLRKSKKLGETVVTTNSLYTSQVVEAVRGFKLVKASGLENYIINKFKNINYENTHVSKKLLDYASAIKFLVQACLSIAMVSIVYLSLAIFEIEISKIMVFVLLLIRMAPKYSSVQGAYRSFIIHLPALNIVDQMKSLSDAAKEELNTHSPNNENIKEKIEIKNVSFNYNNDNIIINNISLKIKLNSFVAIVGVSGAGKSTLIDIILGLLKPSSGAVLIDNDNLNSINLEEHRSRIGFVPQENIFFSGTLRENLTFDKKIDNSFIEESLEIAQLSEFIKSLPKGLETLIGEGGVKLSGGQRQRLSIARALIRNPQVLILDEATSSLDSKSEVNFQRALEAIASNYTIIVVAHRLSTVKKASNIFVMNEGKIVEQGSFKELRSKNGLFTEMIESQFIEES